MKKILIIYFTSTDSSRNHMLFVLIECTQEQESQIICDIHAHPDNLLNIIGTYQTEEDKQTFAQIYTSISSQISSFNIELVTFMCTDMENCHDKCTDSNYCIINYFTVLSPIEIACGLSSLKMSGKHFAFGTIQQI